MPGGKQPQVMHLSTRGSTPQQPKMNQQQPINLSTKNKPPEPITISTKGKLPKKTAEVKHEPVRRRAQPIGQEGIPMIPSSSGERREVMPSRDLPGDPEEPPVKNIVENVLSDLDDVIVSKYKEYNDFCDALIAEDEMNRAMLTEEQIAAEVGSPDEDPLDKTSPSPQIAEEEAFKEPDLDPMEIAMGVGKVKQKDYNSYKKSTSIFASSKKEDKSNTLPKKEEIPQVKPEPPKETPHASLPFVLEKQEDGTLVQGQNIEDIKDKSFNGLVNEYASDYLKEMITTEPEPKPYPTMHGFVYADFHADDNNPDTTSEGNIEHYENSPLTAEEVNDINEMLDKTVGDMMDNLVEKVPEIKSVVKDIPAKSMADFFANDENFQEIEDNSFQEEETIKEDTKEKEEDSSDYTTIDELLEGFELNEEDQSRMEQITERMTMSPEERARLVAQQQREEAAQAAVHDSEVEETTTEEKEEPNVLNTVATLTPATVDQSIFADIDDEDFKELDEEDDEESEDPMEDENMKELQKEITDKVKVVTNKFDIKTYSISQKPISYQAALRKEEANERVTDWVLMASNRHIAFTPFSGPQLEKINPNNPGRNTLNSVRTQWQEIYEHVVDPYKPATLEQWAKTIRVGDIDNIYMGIYVSCFLDSNYIPYSCEHCKSMFLSDNVNILDMIKYKNETAKEKFRRLYEAEPSPDNGSYPTEIIPISDTIAVQIKNPSIYDVLFETSALDRAFREKYEQVLALMVYIEGMYRIDHEAKMVVPIAVKQYPTNMAKNVKSKIITFSKILNSVSPDSYSMLQACIKNLIDDKDEITYEIPEATCKKCGTVIPKQENQQAINILFTRHQLAALASM